MQSQKLIQRVPGVCLFQLPWKQRLYFQKNSCHLGPEGPQPRDHQSNEIPYRILQQKSLSKQMSKMHRSHDLLIPTHEVFLSSH